MAKKRVVKEEEECCGNHQHHGGKHCHTGNMVYGLGFIGSAIYYVSTATGFWIGVLGILKSIVWPAYLVYGILKFLGI